MYKNIKKRGPSSLLCMRMYWDLLPRMVYFKNNKSKKKIVLFRFFCKNRGGGGDSSLLNHIQDFMPWIYSRNII